jgi:hypothetical protein
METFRLRTETQFKELLQFPNNHEFNCYLWKDISVEAAKEVVVMFNGFLEGVSSSEEERDRLLFRYKLIAKELNRNNIVAILLPLPFHFDRSIGVSSGDDSAPIQRLQGHGSFLYYGGFTQVVSDIESLHTKLKGAPSEFGLRDDFRISILGYSIGGVSAISAANHLENKMKVEISSLILMLSAWKLQDIDPKAIGGFFNSEPNFNEDTWTRMLEELNILENDNNVDSLFKYLIWGTGQEIDFENLAKKVLFIDGQFDEIFHPEIIRDRRQTIQQRNLKNCTFISIPSNHLAIQRNEAIPLAKYIALYLTL